MWKRARDMLGKRGLVPALGIGTTVVVSAIFVAQGVLRLRQRPAALPQVRARIAQPSQPVALQALAEQVLQRNIFDSTTGAMSWRSAEELAASAPDAAVPDAPLETSTPCPDTLRLVASVVSARDPERSFAGFRKDSKVQIVALGGVIADLTLAALYPTHAYLQSQTGGLCMLPVYMSAHQPPPPPPPPPAPEPKVEEKPDPGRKPPAFSEEELQKHIRVLGTDHYAVTRDLFLRARLNPSGISRGTRFTPKLEDGRPIGMEIIKIRDDSLLSHLGLKQGDVVRRLNGFNLGTPDGVLEAFGHMGKQDKLSLSVERNGAVRTIKYVLE